MRACLGVHGFVMFRSHYTSVCVRPVVLLLLKIVMVVSWETHRIDDDSWGNQNGVNTYVYVHIQYKCTDSVISSYYTKIWSFIAS